MIFGTGSPKVEATIHEGPIASWCSLMASGNDTPLNPPGISGRSKTDNIARPLIASGMLAAEFDPAGPNGPGVYITPDTDHPAVKVVLDGTYFLIEPGNPGPPPTPNVFLANVEPDPEFPAFMNCPNFASHPHP